MNAKLKHLYIAAFLSTIVTVMMSPTVSSRFVPHSLDEYPQLIEAELEQWRPLSIESLSAFAAHNGVVDGAGNWIIPPKYCEICHDPILDVYWVSDGKVKSPTTFVVFNHRFELPRRYNWQCLDRNGRKINLPLPNWATTGPTGKPTIDEATPNEVVGEISEPDPPWLLKSGARGHYVGHNLWAVRFEKNDPNKIDWAKQSLTDLYDLDLPHLTAIVDRNGTKVADIPGGCASWQFSDGLFCVSSVKDGRKGTIDLSFKQVTPFAFSNLDDFSEGRAFAIVDVRKKSKGGYVNPSGKFCTAQNYDTGDPFKDGRAIVNRRVLSGVIDRDGKEIIPVKYDRINPLPGGKFRANLGRHVEVFSHDGQLLAQNNLEKDLLLIDSELAYDNHADCYTLRDEVAHRIGSETFEEAEVVSSNQIVVCKKATESGSKYFGLIDSKGKWLFKPKFSSLKFISKDRFFAYPTYEEISD